MSTTTQGFIGLRHRISAVAIDPNLAVVVLFSALGLLATLLYDPFSVVS
jgi:hypothetical protein